MFSSIISLAITEITITDDVPTECSEINPRPVLNKIRNDPPSDSFLSVLADKNRTISNLKKQLQNQKMQLSFYIKKELDRSKIEELSESCTPQASDESLPLSLALNKFCRQAGIKTKLSLLHERMNHLDCRISHSLKDQEFLLRKIVNKLCEFVKCQERTGYVNFKKHFGSFIMNPLHVDLFDKLLGSTLGLRRKLDSFKICCDRVLLIEEERNYIVEQVYAMPAEERINCNYLLGIEMEKAQLENEIRRISRHRAESRHRIKELNVIEKILHNLQWELNSSFLKNEQESCISKLLKKINSEARVLLEMTKEQKRRVESSEVSKTKCPDPARMILYIRRASASDGDKLDGKELERCGIKNEDEIRLFQMVKGEVETIKNKTRQEAEKEKKKLIDECEKLKSQITQVLLENSRTKVSNSALKQELEELKLDRKNGLQRLKRERDAYKSQVEDLQAIREAYAQLVDKQPNTTQMERDFLEQIDDRDKKILDLHSQVLFQNQEMERLKAKILEQKDQIGLLNRYISLNRPNSPNETIIIENPPSNGNDNTKENTSQYHKKSNNSLKSKDQPKPKKEDPKPVKLDVVPHRVTSKNAEPKIVPKSPTKHSQVLCTLEKNLGTSYTKSKIIKKATSESSSQNKKEKSITYLKMYSRENEDSSDMLEVMTAKNLERNIRMQASVFSMEIKYTKSIDRALLDEFELFKDCSVESVIPDNC